MKKIILYVWSLVPRVTRNLILKIRLKWKNPNIALDATIICELNEIESWRIQIGRWTYLWNNVELRSCEWAGIQIWKFCSIAANLYAITYNHPTEYISSHVNQVSQKIELNQDYKKQAIKIGNDVWIWTWVTILPGIEIWDGAIIGAWSIVTKNIDSYSIWAWNPAKKIKDRFSDDVRKKLNSIKWWDWSDEMIQKNEIFFNSKISNDSINELIESLKT
jgi:acetyltransferase-like isoleucine patch superfamily enzyme